jgi:uncharacterized protein (DUF488 family)
MRIANDPMPTLYTIGHSTHPLDEFLSILASFKIQVLADVRTIPKSRHVPQFNQPTLARALRKKGIEYFHFKDLGGLRKARADSPNAAWRNASFRGYADYMQTPAFKAALKELLAIAREKPTCIMCAEAVPWRCHRSLIGDALLVRRWKVLDIMGESKANPHKITPFAHVKGQSVTYPAE